MWLGWNGRGVCVATRVELGNVKTVAPVWRPVFLSGPCGLVRLFAVVAIEIIWSDSGSRLEWPADDVKVVLVE